MQRALPILLLTLLGAPSLALAAPPKTPDKAPATGLLQQADAIGQQIANIRGLPIKTPIKKGLYNRKQLHTFLLKKLKEDNSDAELLHESLTLKRLGLLPQDLDYKATILRLLTSQVAGFYDPDIKELYVLKGLSTSLQRPTMAHEIFHGIQDQHFGIESLRGPFSPKNFSDQHLAISALLEGDATVAMIDFAMYEQKQLPTSTATSAVDIPAMSGAMRSLPLESLSTLTQLGATSDPSLKGIPPILKSTLIFPYIAGMRFVFFTRNQKTWAEFNKIYKSPPVSTEQILHPEKYIAGELPTFLSFDASTALPGATKIYDNVLGEYQLHVALKDYLRSPRHGRKVSFHDPQKATAGWGGDRLLSYKDKKNNIITVHTSLWDTPKDASEYNTVLKSGVARRHKSTQWEICPKVPSARCTPTKDGKIALIELRGDIVLYIDGVPKAQPIAPLRNAVFSSLKKVPFAQEHARQKAAFDSKKKKKTPGKK